MSAIASSTRSSRIVPCTVRSRCMPGVATSRLDVLGQDVDLEVDAVAGLLTPRVVRAERLGDEADGERLVGPTSTTVSEMPSTAIEPFSTR